MNTAFALIAFASLATACVLLVYVALVRRDERARSEARVAALAAAVRAESANAGGEQGEAIVEESATPDHRRGGTPALPADNAFTGSSLFAEQPPGASRPQVEWRRFGAATAVPFVVAAVIALALATGGRGGTEQPSVTAPLALMSLGHEHRASSLIVTGSVNVPAALDGRQVDAVVQLFDGSGRELSRLRTATANTPEPSAADRVRPRSFSASIEDASGVGRYRVRFQLGDDVLPHIDRRRAGGPLSVRR